MRDANQYLFLEKDQSAPSVIIIRYYMSCVQCYVLKDASEALKYLAFCLFMKPVMAECWCLLGDIHYHLLNSFDKAYHFYDNAILLGSRRLSSDEYPMEISKYKEYPEKMLANCKEILNSKVTVKEFFNL